MKSMITAIFVMASFAALAQSSTPVVDGRQAAQRARIREGRQSGELTNGEAARLNAEQRRIRRTERRAKADGQVTRQERRRLHREQRRANRDIHRQKHDTQRSGS